MQAEQLWRQAQSAQNRHELHTALRLFTQAEVTGYDPDACASARWNCHMLLGDYESAWVESDAIERRGRPDPNRFWNGETLDGRDVLIRCLHGLGDTLQYIRFAPLLRERAKSLTVEAQPLLRALLAGANIADNVITWGDKEPFWDSQIEIVELPRIFRATLDSLPKPPYLSIGKSASLPTSHGGLRVGIVWGSGAHNRARSIPIHEFSMLFNVANVSFYSLQGGEERHTIAPWSSTIPSLFTEPGDVLPTAEGLNSLDLVITVDTMTAHLAGALGRAVWTLLPFHCDWRWMLNREDSPWYPTMRLFRQQAPGDWRIPLERVKEALIAAAIEHQAPAPAQPRTDVRFPFRAARAT